MAGTTTLMWIAAILALIGVSFTPVPIDLDGLPRGNPPAIPWYADHAIHDGSARVPLGDGSPGDFVKAAGGFVVRFWINDTSDDAILFIGERRDATLDLAPGDTHDLFGPVISADKKLVAWSSVEGLDGDSPGARLVIADGATGEVLNTKSPSADLRPVGFLGDSIVVFRSPSSDSARVWKWDWADDTISPWEGVSDVTAVSAGHHLAATVDDDGCTSVIDTRLKGPQELWSSCDVKITAFSPDGTRTLATIFSPDSEPGPATDVQVRHARTGQRIANVSVGGDGTAVFEDGENLLLSAWDPSEPDNSAGPPNPAGAARSLSRQGLVRWTASEDKRYVRPPLSLAAPLVDGGGYLLPTR